MARYGYPDPCAPGYKKPTSIEDCLSQARIMAKKTFGRGALGPVKRADQILIVTYPDQDKYVKEAIIQALEEEGAEKVDFFNDHELGGKELVSRSVENGWAEAERMAKALPGINCEGDYFKDYVPDPLAYLKKRMKENKPI